jgi:hypothetical protein
MAGCYGRVRDGGAIGGDVRRFRMSRANAPGVLSGFLVVTARWVALQRKASQRPIVGLCRFAARLTRNYFARRESVSSRLSQGGIVERWRTDLSADSDPALGLSFHTCDRLSRDPLSR